MTMFQTKDTLGIKPTLNDSKMIADFVISTPALDRDNEIMVQEGIILDDFRAGPAPWFFNHQQIPFPIGSHKERATERDCPIDVYPSAEFTRGRCWFNQATKEAEVIYHLVKIGHLGATSIGFQGRKSSEIRGDDAVRLGSPSGYIRRWDEWELVEDSIVGVGANREALTMHMSRGHIGKYALNDVLKKAFAPFVLPAKIWSSGSDLSKSKPGAKMAESDSSESRKPTHDALDTFAKGITSVLEAMVPKLALSELEDIKSALTDACKGAWESVQKLIESHGSDYDMTMPELPKGLKFDEPEEEEESETEKAESDPEEDDDGDMTDEEEKAAAKLLDKLERQIAGQERLLASV